MKGLSFVNEEGYMDDILMALGGLLVKREMRQEEALFVEIRLNTNSAYALRWNVGNVLDVMYKYTDPVDDSVLTIKLASFYLTADGLCFGRSLAMMIYGVVIGYDRCERGF